MSVGTHTHTNIMLELSKVMFSFLLLLQELSTYDAATGTVTSL
jgi:hypothetical protein